MTTPTRNEEIKLLVQKAKDRYSSTMFELDLLKRKAQERLEEITLIGHWHGKGILYLEQGDAFKYSYLKYDPVNKKDMEYYEWAEVSEVSFLGNSVMTTKGKIVGFSNIVEIKVDRMTIANRNAK